MDTRFLGLDDLVKTLGLTSQKAFECYYESALKERETLDLNIEGFDWADPQIDFDYEFLEAQGYLRGMATYVDLNSDPLARGRKASLKKYTGSIPRQKRKETYGEDDYRKELIAANSAATLGALRGESPATTIREYLWNCLFDRMKEFPDSHNASLSFQVGQMKSKRALTLTADNNPGGLSGVTYTANVPDENVKKQSWWTIDSAGNVTYVASADPITALMEKVYDIHYDRIRGYRNVSVEMDNVTFLRLIKHPAVLEKIGFAGQTAIALSSTKDKAAAQRVGWEKVMTNGMEFAQNYLKIAIGADELIINNTVVGVDKLNSTSKNFDTEAISVFEPDVILIRPKGIIGKIYNVAPLRPDASHIYSSLYGGRGIIEYIYNPMTREQTWRSELTCLAVPTMPKKLFYFEVGGTTVKYTAVSSPSGNPQAQGWYEKVGDDYVLTTDTTVQSAKTYYEQENV